jgi:uncharacterized protein
MAEKYKRRTREQFPAETPSKAARRAMICDPWVLAYDSAVGAATEQPVSPYAAGIMVRTDQEIGFWASPSNKLIRGIVDVCRPVLYEMENTSSPAQYLNRNRVTTIINEGGFRLWGNRTAVATAKFSFLTTVRINDQINQSILEASLYNTDAPVTRVWLEEVADSVNAFMRRLKTAGAIYGGKCWVDPDFNTADSISEGKAYWTYDFTDTKVGENLIFRSKLHNGYIETELLA